MANSQMRLRRRGGGSGRADASGAPNDAGEGRGSGERGTDGAGIAVRAPSASGSASCGVSSPGSSPCIVIASATCEAVTTGDLSFAARKIASRTNVFSTRGIPSEARASRSIASAVNPADCAPNVATRAAR